MNKIPEDMRSSSRHKTNKYGVLEVVEYKGSHDVMVRFLSTGYEVRTRATDIRNGKVKDRMMPIVYGVGYIGVGEHVARVEGVESKVYTVWTDMLKRCYDHKYQEARQAYKGCIVHEDWHDFQVFADWFNVNYVKGYQLDKDIMVEGNKVYSPETCKFVSAAENSIKAHAKSYQFLSPTGDIVSVYNLSAFCRAHGLDCSSMCKVNRGKNSSHKGWRAIP